MIGGMGIPSHAPEKAGGVGIELGVVGERLGRTPERGGGRRICVVMGDLAIHNCREMDCFVALLLAMTILAFVGRLSPDPAPPAHPAPSRPARAAGTD